MYWSAVTTALVPAEVVTKILRVLAAWAGEIATISVSLIKSASVVATAPKATLVAPVKLVPVMVTVVPPAIGPEVGETPVTAGTGAGVPTTTAPPSSLAAQKETVGHETSVRSVSSIKEVVHEESPPVGFVEV